jgi:hypothetical protein
VSRPLDQLLASYGQPALIADTAADLSFSVVVRTQGRRADSLNEALDSLAAQTHTDHEVIVVVHGSDAAATEVEDAMGARHRVRVIAVDGGGRSRPLNTGLAAASGDYVCFLDDDDLAMPGWLSAFAAASRGAPSTVIRAVTLSQEWATDSGEQPVRPTGEIERPFPDTFDLLAHMSSNLTPNCAVAFPTAAVRELGLRFDESLPVFEDWEFLMRAAMALGVTSIAAETSLYRRLDHGNADTVENEAAWRAAHAAVIDRLSDRPVLLPVGDARRLAGTHFQIGGRSRHESELVDAEAELDRLTRSPIRWMAAFADRVRGAISHRIEERRP